MANIENDIESISKEEERPQNVKSLKFKLEQQKSIKLTAFIPDSGWCVCDITNQIKELYNLKDLTVWRYIQFKLDLYFKRIEIEYNKNFKIFIRKAK